ncbi:MAG: CoA-binding protein [Eubacteriales bacterium]|jgi:acetyltransferase
MKKDLHPLFYPRSAAVLGAGADPEKVGFNIFESIVYGGFKGPLYPIHPKLKNILGYDVYPSLDKVPGPVDVAVIALNQFSTVDVLEECARCGVKGILSIAGGFREVGAEGVKLENKLAERANELGIPLIGPNTLGFINDDGNFYATFYPLRLIKGGVSVISQSGGMGLTIIQKALDEMMGMNKWIGVGNRAVLEFSDYLAYLGDDPSTRVIGVFMEGSEDALKFVKLIREVCLKKPVVVFKAGQTKESDYLAMTHTGSLAGPYRLYKDILKQNGAIVVDTVEELVASCKALCLSQLPEGKRVGVLTHTAGPSIVAADYMLQLGCELPKYAPETIQKVLDVIGQNPPVVLKNPLDAAGLGSPALTYGRITDAVLGDPSVDMILAIYCLHKNWRFPSQEIIDARNKWNKPAVAYYVSTVGDSDKDREMLQKEGVPLYINAREAARAVYALYEYKQIIANHAKG